MERSIRRGMKRPNRMLVLLCAGLIDLPCNRESFAMKVATASKHQADLDNEIRILQRLLPHPNIVKFISAFALPSSTSSSIITVCRFKRVNSGGHKIMVQEYIAGGDLCAQIQSLSQDHDRALAIFARVVDAVAHVHSHGFVHNDIKADNILMTMDGEPKLCDFGLACRIGAPLAGAGTMKYMAPELVSADSKHVGVKADPAHDVWSLGVLLFAMLTGRLPWKRAVAEDKQFYRLQASKFDDSRIKSSHERKASVILFMTFADARAAAVAHAEWKRAAMDAGPGPRASSALLVDTERDYRFETTRM